MEGTMRLPQVTCVLFLACIVACGPSGKKGDDDDVDALSECTNDNHRCQGSTYQTCVGGMWVNAVDCPTGCVDSLGCVDCVPGSKFCQNGDVYECDASGTPGGLIEGCMGSNVCVDGACVDACNDAAVNKSYIGCEYWAVDLDNAVEIIDLQSGIYCDPLFGVPGAVNRTMNVCYRLQGSTETLAGMCDPQDDMMAPHTCPTGFTCQSKAVCVLDAQNSPFAIVVSNPQSKDVMVTVTGPGTNQTITRTIQAGQVSAILPQMGSAIPDQSVDGTGKFRKAYKVTSTLPIVAYQFNPFNNSNVFSNDASLLIPSTAYDIDYYTMSFPTLDRRSNPPAGSQPQHHYYGYLTIVASQDNTQITVTPKVAVQASQIQSTLAAGVPANFTLNAFDVLQLEAIAPADLTGTHITSPNMIPFGVFGGHEAGYLASTTPPAGYTNGPCCADHLEEMLFPSTTWGKSFAIARSEVRKDNVKPRDYIRVMAQKPSTAVTFVPAATSVAGNCGALGPGQFCDVEIDVDTEITATEPVLIGHYLESAIWNDGNPFFPTSVGDGDPSFAIAVPTEQFRKEYTILIPAAYTKNYVSIAAAATGGVQVDGTMVTLAAFPGGGTHRAARVTLTAGQHKITCADGCGVTVYGWSDAVSYMFAGGLDLKSIVIL